MAAPAETVSMNDLVAALEQLKLDNQNLHRKLDRNMVSDGVKALRVQLPNKYDGSKAELAGFLTQLRVYFKIYATSITTEVDKIYLAFTLLTGDALAWFQPIMDDYVDNNYLAQDDLTKEVFEAYGNFEDKLRAVFGDPDKERTSERKLYSLRQKGSVAKYATEFGQIASVLQWRDEPLIAQFYHGLKEEVKDELVKSDRPKDLQKYIELATKIDNRQFERRMEKRGRFPSLPQVKPYLGYRHKKEFQGKKPMVASWGTHAGPMELDAARQVATTPRNAQKSEWRKTGACLKCGKKGHFARQCGAQGERSLQTTTKVKDRHGNLHWSGCYDDKCTAHYDGKASAGWFPKKPTKN